MHSPSQAFGSQGGADSPILGPSAESARPWHGAGASVSHGAPVYFPVYDGIKFLTLQRLDHYHSIPTFNFNK